MLGNDILRKANALIDNRTLQQRAAQYRKLVKIPGPSKEEQDVAALRKAVQDRKFAALPLDEQQLRIAEDILERANEPPAEPDKPSPKQARVLDLITKIVNDPTRPRADFEEAYEVYEQLGPGMDHAVGAEWYDQLAANQQKYLLGKQGDLVRQRQVLQQQADQLTAQMGEFVPSASLVEQRIKLLHGYANNSGKPLPDGMTHDDVVNARNALEAGDSAAAVDVISRASEVIDQWQASIGEAS